MDAVASGAAVFTVPASWLFALLSMMLAGFTWWLRTEFTRNWEEHKEFRAHLGDHNDRMEVHMRRVHRRVDWLIQHSSAPHYEDPGE